METGNLMPAARSYWVLAGKFMAGALPTTPDPEESKVRLKPFLKAGVQCFINLMEPHERDHDGRPFLAYESLVVELAVQYRLPVPQCLRFSIPDLGVPSQALMKEILDTIDRKLGENRIVFLHCWGGKGRTGTVVGCWMMRHGLARSETVLTCIKKARVTDAAVQQASPETSQQIAFVQSWRESEKA